MKSKLDCTTVDRDGLADHLRHNEIMRSEASADSSIYHCQGSDGHSLAIALPGGSGLIVRVAKPAHNITLDRRRARR